jgi:hypothetical protein
MSKWFLNF